MVEVGLALGSNIGDKAANILDALARMESGGGLTVTARSALYRTAPWGVEDQDWFVNACALAETALTPEALLARCKAVEASLGRERTFRWGPRLIDIDIVFYGDETIETPDLTVPHRELFNRAFVLVPLAEIAPGRVIAGRAVAEGLAALERESGDVSPFAPAGGQPSGTMSIG